MPVERSPPPTPEFSGFCSLNDALINTVAALFVRERSHGQAASAAAGRPAVGQAGVDRLSQEGARGPRGSDHGAGCCKEITAGVSKCAPAQLIDQLPNLEFRGMLSYDGPVQHTNGFAARKERVEVVWAIDARGKSQ